jgi:hypothetical protein
VLLPNRFFAVNIFVELFGTSDDCAIGISILFTTTGSGVLLGVDEGVARGEGVALCVAVGDGAGITFPESQVMVVLPLLFTLIHVKTLPL